MIKDHYDGSIARAFKAYLKNEIEAYLQHQLSTEHRDHKDEKITLSEQHCKRMSASMNLIEEC